MIPSKLIDYLQASGIPFARHSHPRAITAQELAASVHMSGYRVTKAVLAEVDGQTWLAVLPAAEMLDLQRLTQALGATRARLLAENEFEHLFPDCEIGAEPPFGRLFGLPVICDDSLSEDETIICRAGSHEEAIELTFDDFARLENPRLASIGTPFAQPSAAAQPEARV